MHMSGQIFISAQGIIRESMVHMLRLQRLKECRIIKEVVFQRSYQSKDQRDPENRTPRTD
jgi:hypothetical protein